MAFLDDDEEIEHIGNKWVEAIGISTQIRRNGLDALKGMKFGGHISDYVIIPDQQMPNSKGQYVGDLGKIFLRQSVFESLKRDEPSARWVVFEEISHAALKHSGIRNFSETKTVAERLSPRIKRQEAEARRLAATIMAPFDLSNYTVGTTASDLQIRFGLTTRVAEIRLGEIERIFRARNRKRRELPPFNLDFLAKPKADISPFEGDPCPNPNCGELKLIRHGRITQCMACGTVTGDD